MSRIRVVLADDHTVLREGLAALLGDQPDIDVVAEASDGAGAVRSALAQGPDVVLMDISMPGMDGIEATRRVRSELPEAQVLALTMHDEEAFFFHMLQAGAAGYLLKGASSEELIEAIHVVHSGGIYLNPAMARRLMDDYLHRVPAEQSELDLLTPREREVLTLLADG
ncbi:MAG: response regulator, partial [Anaerolineae bacterium]